MTLSRLRQDYEAGYRAGWRDGKDGLPVSLFAAQRRAQFGWGYLAGHQAVQVGPQETWSDLLSDLLLEHDRPLRSSH